MNYFMYHHGMQPSYRPEQMRVYKILLELYPKDEIKLEYVVRDLKPYSGIDLSSPFKRPILDIAVLREDGQKVAIRLMGEIHKKSRRYVLRDEDQRLVLVWNGWKVIDLWFDQCPMLWSGKKGYELEIIDKIKKI